VFEAPTAVTMRCRTSAEAKHLQTRTRPGSSPAGSGRQAGSASAAAPRSPRG
jgi:hypothetical protein